MGMFNLSERVSSDSDTKVVMTETVVDGTIAPTTVIEDTKSAPDGKPDDKAVIVLDGPLSHIYTQALNLAYAKEGMDMMLSHFGSQVNDEENAKEGKIDDTYLYCIDNNHLSTDTLLASTESLRVAKASGKYKRVILAMETDGSVGSSMQLLGQMGESLGIEVAYTRNGAISNLINGYKRGA